MHAKHTPGPWATKPTASLGPQYAVYPEESGRDVALVYDHDEHTEANARLIAAAPGLLEACKRLLTAIERNGLKNAHLIDTEFGMVPAIARELTIARAAIARATS